MTDPSTESPSVPGDEEGRTVRVIGAPTDYGANRRGVDMGPSAIRYAGLAESLEAAGTACTDRGDLPVPRPEGRDPDAAGLEPSGGRAKFLQEIASVSQRLADRVAAALDDDTTPVVLGGDHSVAIGSLAGTTRDADVGVIYLDAHADFNTPTTSPSGNVHGMSLAASLGLGTFADREWARAPGLTGEDIALVGLRDVDPAERDLVRDSGAAAYTISEVDERGIAAVLEEALDRVSAPDGLHVSLDLDVLDPNVAPGVGTPVRGGLTYREAHAAVELIAESDELRSLELVEVNPILDTHNTTAELAVELAASALGKRIL